MEAFALPKTDTNSERFTGFLDSLDADQFGRLLARWRRMAAQGPFTPSEFAALERRPPEVDSRTPAEVAAAEQHGEALAKLEVARTTWMAACEARRTAESRRSMDHPSGMPGRTTDEEIALAEAREAERDAREAFEEAGIAEVAARPWNQKRKRGSDSKFPFAGILRRGA
jgi:hypothetical protein